MWFGNMSMANTMTTTVRIFTTLWASFSCSLWSTSFEYEPLSLLRSRPILQSQKLNDISTSKCIARLERRLSQRRILSRPQIAAGCTKLRSCLTELAGRSCDLSPRNPNKIATQVARQRCQSTRVLRLYRMTTRIYFLSGQEVYLINDSTSQMRLVLFFFVFLY